MLCFSFICCNRNIYIYELKLRLFVSFFFITTFLGFRNLSISSPLGQNVKFQETLVRPYAKCDLDNWVPSLTAVANLVFKTNKRVLTAKTLGVKQQTSINFTFKRCHQQQHHHCYLPQSKWQSVGGVKQTKQLPLIEVENSTIYWVISFCFLFFLPWNPCF